MKTLILILTKYYLNQLHPDPDQKQNQRQKSKETTEGPKAENNVMDKLTKKKKQTQKEKQQGE